MENRQAPEALTQLPPGEARATSGPRLLNPTLVPMFRRPAIPATPAQFAGESTGPPSLPAETTTVTPAATTSLMTIFSADVHAPVPPRLILMICAGLALSGMPFTCRPAAHRMASR